MAAPTLETDGTTLRITDGTSGDPVTFNDVWDWDDGGGSSGGNGDVPVDGGGTEKVSAYMTEHIADAVYQILKNIQAGNDVDSTYFLSKSEFVYFNDTFRWQITDGATLCMGALNGEIGIQGAHWSTSAAQWTPVPNGDTTAVWLMYGSSWKQRNGVRPILRSGTFTMVDSTLPDAQWYIASGTHTYTRVNFVGIYYTLVSATLNDCFFEHITSVGGTNTISDARLRNTTDLTCGNIGSLTLIDAIGTIGTISITTTETNYILDQKSVNIHVNDKDGADLAGVAITATSYGNIVSPSGTGTPFYRCIVGHKAGTWATDLAAGKWELTSNANAALAGVTGLSAATGAWVTLVDYAAAAATEISAVETDANGDIAEDYLTYRKWIGLSEAMLSYAPYTFALSRTNYETLTMENIVPTAAIVWSLELQDEAPTRYDVEKETTNITANGVPVAVTKFDLTTISE